ncbi:ROK family protein [Micromonospora sp. MP36]|nr:ROK family protein [Micromonospora sp. MP36]
MKDGRPAGTPVLRRINRAAVLDAFRQSAPDPVRLAELTRMTALTRPTVTQAVEDLLAAGWLQQHAPEPSAVGRPATRFSLNGRAAPVLGLDVGPHTVAAGVADLAGERLGVVHRTVRRPGARQLLEVVDEAISEALSAAVVSADQIAAVTAATPGIVEATSGRVLFAPSVPGWSAIDLVDRMRQRFTCPVMVDNDANLAALAVAHEHTGSGTLLAVHWGERLGAGVVIDGRLHRGAGAAGEIGFIRPVGDLPDDTGDGRGPLERAIGAEAITDLARRYAAEHPESSLGSLSTDPATVFRAAADGDLCAHHVVDRIAFVFAQAIAPCVLVLSPHTMVISGGIARAGSVLRDAVARHLDRLTLTSLNVELSGLAEETVLTGALRMALDEVWRSRLTVA